ncbi:hypothetical protein BKA70DRAFT_1285316, partial [Coprinopsis sp. MPI-PUGE-AT-0042]
VYISNTTSATEHRHLPRSIQRLASGNGRDAVTAKAIELRSSQLLPNRARLFIFVAYTGAIGAQPLLLSLPRDHIIEWRLIGPCFSAGRRSKARYYPQGSGRSYCERRPCCYKTWFKRAVKIIRLPLHLPSTSLSEALPTSLPPPPNHNSKWIPSPPSSPSSPPPSRSKSPSPSRRRAVKHWRLRRLLHDRLIRSSPQCTTSIVSRFSANSNSGSTY